MITSRGNFIIATPTKCGTTTLEEMARRHAGGRISRGGVWQEDFRIMDWEHPRRQHRMALPPQRDGDRPWGDVQRCIVVRNPYLRYLSMYMYLREARNFSQWGAREVQGSAWPGPMAQRLHHEPMAFETFLHWLADRRADARARRVVRQRGDLRTGRAYRSPWVWLDPLPSSVVALASQPGSQAGVVVLLKLEALEQDLGAVLKRSGVSVAAGRGGSVVGIRANRTMSLAGAGGDSAAGEGWAWGGVRHGRHVFDHMGAFQGPCEVVDGCTCGACVILAAEEARFLGYC